MNTPGLPDHIKKQIIVSQQNEITEYYIYTRLAKAIKNTENKKLLEKIGEEELEHHNFWHRYTQKETKPSRWKIFKFIWLSRIFGITFGIKLMEKGEEKANINYIEIARYVAGAKQIAEDEDKHEQELVGLIEEEKLNYIGSIVLGLNDALVELTGALAGLTFALQNTRLIALAGLITGIAASFSMAASEYLSTKSEGNDANALKSSAYTGIAYIFTVTFLVLPYLLISNYFVCLAATLFIAMLIIFLFNYYVSVVKDISFKKRFFGMTFLSMGVAAFSFGIGYVVRIFLGVEI